MRRLLILICALLLTGCAFGNGGKEQASPGSLTEQPVSAVEGDASSGDLEINDPWGIALTVKNVAPSGLTVICTQSGGTDVTELHSGQYYVLEKRNGDGWDKCEPVIERYAFTQEAWIIPLDDSVEWKVDFEWLYGQLAPGTYRVGKEITNFRGPGDYDTSIYFVEFTV